MKTSQGPQSILPYASSTKFLTFALLLFTFIVTYTQIYSGDIWWSLAEGREIFNNWSLPDINQYAYTYPNHPWISTQWLFSLVAFIVYGWCGINGLILTKILVVLLLVSLLTRQINIKSGNYRINTFLMALFILAILFRVMLRAHLFSLLFFVIYLVLIERLKKGGLKTLLGIIPITILWVNFHSGVVYGIGLLTLVFIETIIFNLIKNSWKIKNLFKETAAGYLLSAIGLALLATLLNPRGIHYLVHTLSHLNINQLIAIMEYQPPWKLGWSMAPFYLLSILVLIFTVLRLKSKHGLRAYDLVTMVFLFFSFRYNRIIPYFASVAVLQIISNISLLYPVTSNPVKENSRTAFYNLGLGSILILLPLLLIGKIPFLPDSTMFGLGISNYHLPVKATRFIKAHPPDGNGFNKYYWGGYLAWNLYPEKSIFVDGRIPAYPRDFISRVRRMVKEPAVLVEIDREYDFSYLIIDNKTFKYDFLDYYTDTTWALVFWDRNKNQIYVKRNTVDDDYIEKFAYRLYSPGFNILHLDYIKSKPDQLRRLQREVEQHLHWTNEQYDRDFLAEIKLLSADSR